MYSVTESGQIIDSTVGPAFGCLNCGWGVTNSNDILYNDS